MPKIIFDELPPATTEGNVAYESSFKIEQIAFWDNICAIKAEVKIPDSFWAGLKECDSGRVVDMEKALTELPPK
jgi:hypothetical protein